MSKTVYVTGDRSLDPMASVALAAQAMGYIVGHEGHDIEIMTGDSVTGVERAVRYLLLDEAVVVARGKLDNGKPDFDATHEALVGIVDAIYVFHTAPLDSTITKSIMRYFPEEIVHLPMQDGVSI